jgi:hypothetical protein
MADAPKQDVVRVHAEMGQLVLDNLLAHFAGRPLRTRVA